MAFPTSPSNGDQTTINGVLYQYNSTKTAWVRVANPGLVAGGAIYETSQVMSESYTVGTGKNIMTVGPLTLKSGVSLTIPSGSKHVVL